MRLLKRENRGWFPFLSCEFSLTEYAGDRIPNYAILSHTWGKDSEEVNFEDLGSSASKSKAGYEKLRFCADQAARDGLLYFWVDTCCINKASSSELQEAVNSMFGWYGGATKCYVYLADVSTRGSNKDGHTTQSNWETAFQRSRWFTRGWTLQELIAPQSVEFFSKEALRLGDRNSLRDQINKITGINPEVFQGKPLSEFSVDERMSWATKRQTTRGEDAAYSLLGLFDIHIPLIYGEGQDKAMARLQKEIQSSSNPPSLPLERFISSVNDAPVDLLSIHFTGRERELATIRSAHDIERDTPTRCAIWGIPGVGKSQLALRYAKVFLEDKILSIVFWMSASSVEKLYQGFSKLLNLVNHPDQLKLEQNSRVMAARRWLEQPEVSGVSRWLLILDNVDPTTLDFLRENLPRQCNKGRILITTRTEHVARAVCEASGAMHQFFELETPTVEDAATLFVVSAGIKKESLSDASQNQVTELVKHLGRLPFAVNQAASFMLQSYQTVDAFIQSYRGEENPQIFDWHNDFSVYESKSISAMFTSSLRVLRESSPDVLNLLNVLVFFDPENIEIESIKTGASALHLPIQSSETSSKNVVSSLWKSWGIPVMGEIFRLGSAWSDADPTTDCSNEMNGISSPQFSELESLTNLVTSEIQLHNALHRLQMLSFVKRRPVHERGALYIHDLTRALVQRSLIQEGEQTRWFKYAVQIVCGAFRLIETPTSPKYWHQCEGLISHILSLAKHSESLDDKNFELLLAKRSIAAYWCSRGRYHEAIEAYQQIMAIESDQLDSAGFDVMQIRSALAEANWHAGEYGAAALLYEEAQRIQELQLGDDHPDTLSTAESIAMVRRSQGQYEEALLIFEHVLAKRESSFPPNHSDTIRTVDNLALTLGSQGQYVEAEALYKRALTEREALLGTDHLDTLFTVNNLANNIREQGRYAEALILLERTLRGRRSQLGDDHPNTLYTLADIAKIFSAQGRFSEAEKLYEQALAGNEKLLGHHHQETLWVVTALANLYHLQERFEESAAMYHRGLISAEEHLGYDHPNTLRMIHGLANLRRDRADFTRSEELYERLLKSRQAKLRPGHPETLQTFQDIAKLFVRMGRNLEAEQYLRQALAQSTEKLGRLHPDTIKMKKSLVNFLEDRQSQGNPAMGDPNVEPSQTKRDPEKSI